MKNYESLKENLRVAIRLDKILKNKDEEKYHTIILDTIEELERDNRGYIDTNIGLQEIIKKHAKTIENLEQDKAELLEHCKDIWTNYDCDTDAHKYNTPCRCCSSEKIYKKFIGRLTNE